MTVIYLDSVFLFNALLDYLLVLAAARLAGIPLRRKRYALCGILGGLYAAAVFLPGWGFLAALPVKAAAGVLLALLAFGGERHFWRLTLLTFAIACVLAGMVLALGLLAGQSIPNARGVFYTDINGGVLLVSATGIYLLMAVIFRAAAAHGLRGERIPVRVSLLGRTTALTALRDTGHSLRDAAGNPVLTVERRCFPQLPPETGKCCPAEALPLLRRRFPELCPQLLPVRTASGSSLLLSVRSDWAVIDDECRQGLRIALTETELGGGYTALWGGEGRKHHVELAAEFADASGTAAGGGDSLHRGQRHPAAAPEPGAGGGTAEPAGGGRRPAGTD